MPSRVLRRCRCRAWDAERMSWDGRGWSPRPPSRCRRSRADRSAVGADHGGVREREPERAGRHRDDRLPFACTAPTPSFSLPAHGSVVFTGTLASDGKRKPFSRTVKF
jgi:hypothetical protein